MTAAAKPDRRRFAALAGTLVAAVLASACCLGPLLLAVVGAAGGAAAFSALARFRPYFLAATALMLAAGFYLSYRQPRADDCGCELPRAKRRGRLALWIAVVVTALSAAAPRIVAGWSAGHEAAAAPATVAHAVIRVDGMDCEACAAPIRGALAKVGGLHALKVDLPGHAVAVDFEPAPGRLDAYVRAIDDLGYEAAAVTAAR